MASAPPAGTPETVEGEVLPARPRHTSENRRLAPGERGRLDHGRLAKLRPPGGRIKLTAELVESALPRIKQGFPPDTAFQALGVHYATYQEWQSIGMRDVAAGVESDYATLVEVVATHQAQGEMALVEKALQGDKAGITWGPSRTALEYLKVTHRRYGDKVRIQNETEITELLGILERICSDAGREDILALFLQELAARDRH